MGEVVKLTDFKAKVRSKLEPTDDYEDKRNIDWDRVDRMVNDAIDELEDKRHDLPRRSPRN